jgi:hypothetical protein
VCQEKLLYGKDLGRADVALSIPVRCSHGYDKCDLNLRRTVDQEEPISVTVNIAEIYWVCPEKLLYGEDPGIGDEALSIQFSAFMATVNVT